jgi:hypothetical protein
LVDIKKIILVLVIIFATSKACNVPVFRYALERWATDIYQVFVFTEEDSEAEAFQLLEKNAVVNFSLSNYSLRTIDVTTAEGKRAAETNQVFKFPWLSVYYPANAQVRGLVWEGPLEKTNVERLINSPVRTQLAKKILAGKAAVWLFLKSSNAEKDKAALEILRTTLDKASKELKIPNTSVDIDGNAIEVTDFVDYDVHFDLIEISRENPQEIMLLSMLLGSESDLAYLDGPMAFPVFGRGRSLYAIVGKGINEENVYHACQSIIAWCSCEIKAQNPGIDLLVSADWSKPVGGQMVKDEELPPLTGFSEFIPPEPEEKVTDVNEVSVDTTSQPIIVESEEPVPINKEALAEKNKEKTQAGQSALLRNLLMLIGFVLIIILVTTLLLKSKASKSQV